MKMQYKTPAVEVVEVRLQGTVLEDVVMGGESIVGTTMDAKETEFEDESLINPTQPNLWDDNEEE